MMVLFAVGESYVRKVNQICKIDHIQRMRSLVTDFGRTDGIKVRPKEQAATMHSATYH